MKHISIIVRADWDDEANVWVATSSDINGLCVEAETIETLEPKIRAAIQDLVELNGIKFETPEIPIHILAQQVARIPNPLI